MKTLKHHLLTLGLVTGLSASSAIAQDGGGAEGSGVGVGIGVGAGVGVGTGGNLQVERIPAHIVGGRRVFSAAFVIGHQSVTNPPAISTTGGPLAPTGSREFRALGSRHETHYDTVLTLFNPTAADVDITHRAVMDGNPGNPVKRTIPAFQTVTLRDRDVERLLGSPAGFPGPRSTGMIVVESPQPLDVVAVYEHRTLDNESYVERVMSYSFGIGTSDTFPAGLP